jgi:hypothetical protein
VAVGVGSVEELADRLEPDDAERSRDEADAAARDARIEALVGRAESLRVTQRDAAALLAVEAYRLADTPRTRSAPAVDVHRRRPLPRRPSPRG